MAKLLEVKVKEYEGKNNLLSKEIERLNLNFSQKM